MQQQKQQQRQQQTQQDTVARYRRNLQGEVDGTALYEALATAEPNPPLAALYQRLADLERRHAELWRGKLREAGADLPDPRPSARSRLLGWLARRFGASAVLPIVTAAELSDSHLYDNQPEARAAGLPTQERAHARVFSRLSRTSRVGLPGQAIAQIEGRHRASGGNALRAAVLGANDGLVSNFSLVMGVAGAALQQQTILFTGLAGMLAGAISMALGEWLSVQSSRELHQRQISIERDELELDPEGEREELALIYQSKGLTPAQAAQVAAGVIADPSIALDTLAREELGIDPDSLGGSAWVAAGTSFLLFALGALLPVLPYFFASGATAIVLSGVVSALGLFLIGAGITLFTGRHPVLAGLRQVAVGLAAAAVTFGVGKLVGTQLGA